jgi:hypothetical protein
VGDFVKPAMYSKRAILAKSAPLPSVCHQYLPWYLLCDEPAMQEAREELRATLYDSLSKLFTGHWELGGNTPEDQATELVQGYDDVTVSLLHKGLLAQWIDHDELQFFRRFNAAPEDTRNIVLLIIAVREAVSSESPIPVSLIWGLKIDNEAPLDFGTDHKFRQYLALLLYGFSVNRSFPEADRLFRVYRSDSGKRILRDDIIELLSRRPEDALRIAALVIERQSHDNDLIEDVLDSVSSPVSEGVL